VCSPSMGIRAHRAEIEGAISEWHGHPDALHPGSRRCAQQVQGDLFAFPSASRARAEVCGPRVPQSASCDTPFRYRGGRTRPWLGSELSSRQECHSLPIASCLLPIALCCHFRLLESAARTFLEPFCPEICDGKPMRNLVALDDDFPGPSVACRG